MQYQNNKLKLSRIQQMVLIAVFVSIALVLSYFERMIPLSLAVPVPGVKLGLANVITLTSLYFLPFGDVLLLIILRVGMNAIFTGSMMSFWYSLSGGILSFLVMYILIRLSRDKLSTVGVSVAGAVSHNIGQLIIVAIITENVGVALGYFPILAVSGVITGILIGLVISYLKVYLSKVIVRR